MDDHSKYTASPFQQVTLIHGPLDGEQMLLSADQDRLEIQHRGKTHIYHRLGHKARLHHESVLGRIGGAR